MTQPNRLLWILPILLFAMPAPVSASMDLREEVEFVAFSKKQKVFCVRVTDPNRGNYLSVRKTRTGAKVKDHPYDDDTAKRTLKRVLRKYELEDEGVPAPASPDGSVTLVGAQRGEALEVLALAEDGRGVFQSIPLEKGEGGQVAKATLKQVIWSTDGKIVILIVNQTLDDGSLAQNRDHVFVERYRAWKVQWQ